VDGVQALGKAPLSLQHVDLFSGSAHKVHGPKGAGFLAIRRGTPLKPLLEGGGHEGGLRAGTQNVAGAVGLARAVTIAVREQPAAARALAPLRDRLRRGLEELEARLNSPADGVPHTTNASFPGIPGEVMLRALEARGVYVSTASACTSRKRARSHVLAAMGLESELADSAIRMSFSRLTTGAEVDATLEALADVRGELFVPAARAAQAGGGRWSR
jgi:cysteine desulfurase